MPLERKGGKKKKQKQTQTPNKLEETKTEAIWSYPAPADGANVFSCCFTQQQDPTLLPVKRRGPISPV